MHGKHTLWRRTWVFGAVMAFIASLCWATFTLPASALGASPFEGGDGNLIVNTAGNTDWLSPPPNFATSLDLASGQTDNSFGNGTKEDNTTVTVGLGSIPNNKADLRRQLIGGEVIGGKFFLYLAATRATTSGTVNYDFEINQAAQPDLTTPGTKTLNRTVGDLLLSYDFAGGSQKPTLTLRKWTAANVWGAPSALTGANSDGEVNRVNIPAAQGEPGDGGYAAFTFAEAVVNLTDALGLPPNTCENIGSFSTHSRSSSSFTSEEKDFIAPKTVHISNCSTIKISKVTENGNSTFNYAANNLTPGQFSLTNGDTQTYTGVQNGSHSVIENLTAQQVSDGWTLKSLVCTDFGGASHSISGATANITTVSGSEVDCVYTNHINFSPTIATLLSNSTINVGDSVHDSATLTGASANAGGTVTYTAYSDNACSQNARDAGTKTVTSGSVPDSDALQFNTAGDFYWQAVYSGDANNNTATSPCLSELLVVKATTTIATTLSQTVVNIGDTVHDTATLSGASATAGGTVTYSAYLGQNNCSGTDLLNSVVPVTNGIVPNSADFTPSAAGYYSFQAVYSGDGHNNGSTSECTTEQLLVKTNPTIITVLSDTSVTVSASVHDSAVLTDATSDASGTVTYTVYSDDTCTAGARDAGTVDVTNGTVPDSNALQFNTAGTFFWQAVYSGDAKNNIAVSACTDETLVVGKETPTASTAQSLIPNDTFTLSGAFQPTGSITFNLYDPNDATCAGPAKLTEIVPVSHNGDYSTSNTSFVASTEGTWRWESSYSGDSNNNPVTSVCGTERFTIANS